MTGNDRKTLHVFSNVILVFNSLGEKPQEENRFLSDSKVEVEPGDEPMVSTWLKAQERKEKDI